MQTQRPNDAEKQRRLNALAIASGRPEDRFSPDYRMPYVSETFAMLRGEREPEDDRERRALAYYEDSRDRAAGRFPVIAGGADLLTL